MRLLLLILYFNIPAFCWAEDWKPPTNPDPSKILNEAHADAKAGNYEVALAKQLWYHENAIKIQPSQSGVRLSFALSHWLELGESFPPALVKLREIRDNTEMKIRDESQIRVRFQDFHDFVALNRTLRQEEQTYETFKWLDEQDEEDAQRVFGVAKPAIIKQKDYKLCGKYLDAEKDVKRIGESYESGVKLSEERFGKQHLDYVHKKVLNDSTTLVAILVQNDRKTEAKDVADKVKTFVKDEDLLKKLNTQLESALEGVVPKPWP